MWKTPVWCSVSTRLVGRQSVNSIKLLLQNSCLDTGVYNPRALKFKNLKETKGNTLKSVLGGLDSERSKAGTYTWILETNKKTSKFARMKNGALFQNNKNKIVQYWNR